VGAAATLSLAIDGMDGFHFLNKIWRGMSVDWTGSRPPSLHVSDACNRQLILGAYGKSLDGACAMAGLRRRCSLTFDIIDDGNVSLDPQLFLALLQGVPSAPILSDIREACVGRLVAAAARTKLSPGADASARFVRAMFKAASGLEARWQRVRFFEIFRSAGYLCTTRVFENPHPIPDVYRRFMYYDPGYSQESPGALPSDKALLQRALEVLVQHESVNLDFQGAQRLLHDFRAEAARDLETYMPSGVYSPGNFRQWYDENGDLALTPSD